MYTKQIGYLLQDYQKINKIYFVLKQRPCDFQGFGENKSRQIFWWHLVSIIDHYTHYTRLKGTSLVICSFTILSMYITSH